MIRKELYQRKDNKMFFKLRHLVNYLNVYALYYIIYLEHLNEPQYIYQIYILPKHFKLISWQNILDQ